MHVHIFKTGIDEHHSQKWVVLQKADLALISDKKTVCIEQLARKLPNVIKSLHNSLLSNLKPVSLLISVKADDSVEESASCKLYSGTKKHGRWDNLFDVFW